MRGDAPTLDSGGKWYRPVLNSTACTNFSGEKVLIYQTFSKDCITSSEISSIFPETSGQPPKPLKNFPFLDFFMNSL